MKLKLFPILLLSLCAAGQNAPAPSSQSPSPSGQAIAQNSNDPSVRKARALIERGIKALGGDAYLNVQTIEQQGRTYGFYHGEPQGGGTQFWAFWKWPDKERMELTKKRDVIEIFNGDNGYEITFRGTAAQEKEILETYLRNRHYSLQQVLRNWLKQPDIALFYEGPATANMKPAEQVSILNSKNEGVTLYFDVDTGLPLKKSYSWRDPKYKDRNVESEIYDNYRNVQGIMTPFSITRQRNDENISQRFITTTTYNQPLSDSMFAARVTWDPTKSPPAKK